MNAVHVATPFSSVSDDERLCECCGSEPVVGVASSGLGAISLAWGRRCIQEGAEPYWLVMGTAEECEGPLPFTRDFAIADWVLDGVTTHLRGEYVSARDAMQIAESHEYERMLDEGCPNDPWSLAWAKHVERMEATAQYNAEHERTAPNGTCSCSACWPLRSPLQKQAIRDGHDPDFYVDREPGASQ